MRIKKYILSWLMAIMNLMAAAGFASAESIPLSSVTKGSLIPSCAKIVVDKGILDCMKGKRFGCITISYDFNPVSFAEQTESKYRLVVQFMNNGNMFIWFVYPDNVLYGIVQGLAVNKTPYMLNTICSEPYIYCMNVTAPLSADEVDVLNHIHVEWDNE
jgi:hypothetical protein